MVWIVDGRRVTVHTSGLVGLLGLIPCGVRGIGHVSKLLGARAEVRLTRAFGRVKLDEDGADRERGVEVTVREHEDREGETEIRDMHTANTLSHACTRYLYVTPRKCACDKSVCVQFCHVRTGPKSRQCGVSDCSLASPDTSQQVAPLRGSFSCSRSSMSLWAQWWPARRGPQLHQCHAKSLTDRANAAGEMTGLSSSESGVSHIVVMPPASSPAGA